jgi:hypothetical protein
MEKEEMAVQLIRKIFNVCESTPTVDSNKDPNQEAQRLDDVITNINKICEDFVISLYNVEPTPPLKKEPEYKILHNKAQCKKCGDIIESHYRHDFVSCKCGSIFVDGGLDYCRSGADNIENFIDLSESELING